MKTIEFEIRNAKHEEFEFIGKLMVSVYAQIDGFPTEDEQPGYYKNLLNVGALTGNENIDLIVAIDKHDKIAGAVVYFSDMKDYGSGGIATTLKNASGFRLLAVDPSFRGKGIGKMLCQECIKRANHLGHNQLYIHSTEAMKIAWGMYERLGFTRHEDIDFKQGELQVFGFKLEI